jgi:hypothetical protein
MISVAVAHGSVAQTPSIALRFVAPPSNITLHEPVVVEAIFENTANQAVPIDLGIDEVGNFKMALRMPDGMTLTADPARRGGDFGSKPGEIDLRPNQLRSKDILLSKWFDFTKPGTYTLALNFVGSPDLQMKRQQQLAFEIAPRDEGALRKTCESLMTIARTGNDVEDVINAAEYLASVKDPIAVSYLIRLIEPGKAIEQPMVEHIAISALERAGEYDALWALMQRVDFNRQVKIDKALQRMERRGQRGR